MPGTTTPITFDPSFLLWVFFTLGMLVTAYFVFGLLFHWLRYGMLYPLVWVAMPVYGIGVFLLVSIMLGAIAIV